MIRNMLPTKTLAAGTVCLVAAWMALFAVTTPSLAHGEIIAQYAFSSGSSASTDVNADSDALAFTTHNTTNEGSPEADAGISSSSHMAYLRTDATGSTETDALDDDDYFSFTVTATSGNVLNLESLVFDLGGSAALDSGFNNTIFVQSSVDGFGSSNPVVGQASSTIAGVGGSPEMTNPGVSIDLTDAKFQGLTSVTFRFSFLDDANTAGSIDRFDNVVLNATVAVPEPTTWAMCLLAAAGLAFWSVRSCPKNEIHQ